MLALGIETGTWMGGVALVDDAAGVLMEQCIYSRSSHSERLLPAIEKIFAETGKRLEDCDCVCVSVGPGSFTGLRIGIATAKGLAYAAGKPVIGISTLEILARGLPFINVPLCPVIDARKKELFACLYEWHNLELVSLGPEMAVKPACLIKKIVKPTVFVGDGVQVYGDMLKRELKEKAIFAPGVFNFPRASILAESGLWRLAKKKVSTPDDIVPVYIRASEAEINRTKKGQ